jgi:hypothetical protein
MRRGNERRWEGRRGGERNGKMPKEREQNWVWD